MQISNNLNTYIEALNRLPQQKIAKAISVLIVCYLAYTFAKITWLVAPNGDFVSTKLITNSSSSQVTKKSKINLSSINSLNLFGIYTDQPQEIMEVEVQDAPETRLNLILSGVVASDDKSVSAAIIENSGKQETYGIGENITGTRAVLDTVFSDRIIIKNAGKLETLMLDGFNYGENKQQQKVKNKSSTTNRKSRASQARRKLAPSPNVVDQRGNKNLANSATSLKSDIKKDPSKITDYLKISPKRKEGKVVGYRLMPGKNPEFFKEAGLKSGDVAVQMNGYDLTTPSDAAQALTLLKQEKEVSLLLDRNGEMTEILFSIN